MSVFRPHQKQFVLGPGPVHVWPDWNTLAIADGLVLSVCPKLKVTRLQSRDGVAYCLLGFPVLSDQVASIAELFPTKHSSEIEEWTGYWAGKWALVSDHCIWLDAAGFLRIHYRNVGGRVWLSNSQALLGEHLPDAPDAPYIDWQVRHRNGMDWIPPPLTTREGVYKVMPLRTIHPVTGAMRPVRFRPAEMDEGADDNSLAAAMQTILANWCNSGHRTHYLALTAGMDTRLLLATARAAKLKVETRTVRYPEASKADLALPPRLSAAVGIPHKMVGRPNPPLPLSEVLARTRAIVEHLDGATFHPVSAYFAHGLDDFMHDPGKTIAGGWMFALGRCAYWRRFGNHGLGEALPTPDQILDAFFTHSYDPLPFWSTHPRARWREALQIWLDSLAEPRALKLDWREAFHLDQAAGGWCTDMLRIMDLQDGDYFPPANCLWLLHLLVRDPVERRKEAFAHMNAIRIMSPALWKIPTNPLTRKARFKRSVKQLLGDRQAGRLRSILRRVKGAP